jgi:beta propeller repeat protein
MKIKIIKTTIGIISLLLIIMILALSYFYINNEIYKKEFGKEIELKKLVDDEINLVDEERICDIWNDNLVIDLGEEGLYFYDLDKGSKYELGIGDAPLINDKYIVWGEDNEIYLFNILSKKKYQITNENCKLSSYPSIYENKIIWSDNRHDEIPRDGIAKNDIFLYDISTSFEYRITNSLTPKSDPDIYKDKIVWDDTREGMFVHNIYYTKISIHKEIQITSDGDSFNPKIWGDKIAYLSAKEGSNQIYVYDINKKSEKKIDISEHVESFDLHENKIVWNYGNDIIYLFDISTDELTIIINVEDDDGIKVWSPAIWGNKVIFASNKDGSDNIYMYKIPDNTSLYVSLLLIIMILVIILVILIKIKKKKQKINESSLEKDKIEEEINNKSEKQK